MDETKPLTKKQKTVLELLCLHPLQTDKQVAEQAGMSPERLCIVKKLPQFKEEYTRRLDELWKSARGVAQNTMVELATGGDYKASEFILKSLGLGETQKIEASVESKVINVTVDEDK